MAFADLASPANGDLAVLGDTGTVKPPDRECAREWPFGPPGADWYPSGGNGSTPEAVTALAGAVRGTASAGGPAPGAGAGAGAVRGTASAGGPEPGAGAGAGTAAGTAGARAPGPGIAAAAAAASSSAGAPPAATEVA